MTRAELHKLIDTIPDDKIGGYRIILTADMEAHVKQHNAIHLEKLAMEEAHIAKVKELEAHVEALGGTELAQKLARSKARERHLKQIEESQKALAEMGV
jgi:hypothetical protein